MRVVGCHRVGVGESGEFEIGPLETSREAVADAGEATRIGHLSDLHFGKPVDGGSAPARLERWLEAFEKAGVDVVVLSGDLVEQPGDRVGMLRVRHLLERAGMPRVVVPGNHDVGRPGGDGAFYELFGDYPRVERQAGVEFVLLDSLAGPPIEERSPFERLDIQRSGALSTGRVGDRQLRRAAGQLTADAALPRVLVVHHHLRAADEVPGDAPASSAPPDLMVPCLDADRLLDWAARHDVDLAFHGHQHAHWPPYTHEARTAVRYSGSSTRGRPAPRARIVDVAPTREETTIWECALQ